MKSFLDHLKEEVLPSVQVADGGLDIDKPAVRAAINAAIAGVVSQPAVTPYVVFNRLSKLLAQYHIVLPKKFLEGDRGVEVFEIRQFGHRMGMTDSGEFVNHVPSTHYLFLQYGIISPFGITYAKPVVGGMFRVMTRLVDKAELDRLLDMAEISLREEAEQMQAIAKANAPKEEPHTALGDCGCNQGKSPSTKSAISTMMRKSGKKEEQIDETHADNIRRKYREKEDSNDHTGNVHLLTRVFGNKKERETSKEMLRKRDKQGYSSDTEKGYKITKKYAGRLDKLKEDKDPCWKGYEMIGMKKKGNRKVPNCVPVEEATDKDRDLSKLASDAVSKGQSVKKLPAGRAPGSTLRKGMAKGYNIEKGRWSGHGKFGLGEEQIDEVSLEKAARTARLRNMGAERSAHASPYDYSPHIDVQRRKAGKTVDRIERKHGSDTAKKVSRKMEKDTDKVWRGKMEEASYDKLDKYVRRGHVSGLAAADDAANAYHRKDYKELHKHNRTGEKREKGINLALDKMAGRALVPAKRKESMEEEYGVFRKGGSIGEKPSTEPHKTFDNETDAKTHARDMNKLLTPGEKKYYRIKYHVKPLQKEETLDEAGMPASVIKHKQKLAAMTPEEKAKKFAGKTKEQLQAMARRHGYGKGSDEYSKHVKEEQLDEKAPGAKYERMVGHIKDKLRAGGLTKKEKRIAFATAWKAKNREKGE